MNWNNIPNNERLQLWKTLRSEINGCSLEDKTSKVANFFAEMPFANRTLDYYTPDSWPTPWEILFHGTFCISSISLLIFYTFKLIDNKNTIELYLVEDESIYLLPVIDKKFVLNYELGMVNNYSDIKDNFKVLQIYREEIKQIT